MRIYVFFVVYLHKFLLVLRKLVMQKMGNSADVLVVFVPNAKIMTCNE